MMAQATLTGDCREAGNVAVKKGASDELGGEPDL
jgi:hypothetical protein